jgi:hypothetical protein
MKLKFKKVYRHTVNGVTTYGIKTWWGGKRAICQYQIFKWGSIAMRSKK